MKIVTKFHPVTMIASIILIILTTSATSLFHPIRHTFQLGQSEGHDVWATATSSPRSLGSFPNFLNTPNPSPLAAPVPPPQGCPNPYIPTPCHLNECIEPGCVQVCPPKCDNPFRPCHTPTTITELTSISTNTIKGIRSGGYTIVIDQH